MRADRAEARVPTIRPARPEDAPALARLAEATFRATFGATNAPEQMDRHCREHFGAPIQAAEIADPQAGTLLVDDGGSLIGYAQVRWGETPSCIAARSPGEIRRIYLVEAWQGRGLAQYLLAACIDAIRQRGSDAAWLGVWEQNPRAISFYRKCGFVEAGEHVFRLGTEPQRDVIMIKVFTPGEQPRFVEIG